MSDVSSKLSMNGMKFFTQNEILTCSLFNLKMFLFVLTILICVSCIASSLNSVISSNTNSNNNTPMHNYKIRHRCMENFSNNDIYSYKESNQYTYYQSIPLTSNNSLLFGQANRYIQMNDTNKFILDIYANLYVLNGNPFNLQNEENKFKYIVYLKNTTKKVEIGELKKSSDGIYKLHFTALDPNEYMSLNEIDVVYKYNDEEFIILHGKLN